MRWDISDVMFVLLLFMQIDCWVGLFMQENVKIVVTFCFRLITNKGLREGPGCLTPDDTEILLAVNRGETSVWCHGQLPSCQVNNNTLSTTCVASKLDIEIAMNYKAETSTPDWSRHQSTIFHLTYFNLFVWEIRVGRSVWTLESHASKKNILWRSGGNVKWSQPSMAAQVEDPSVVCRYFYN